MLYNCADYRIWISQNLFGQYKSKRSQLLNIFSSCLIRWRACTEKHIPHYCCIIALTLDSANMISPNKPQVAPTFRWALPRCYSSVEENNNYTAVVWLPLYWRCKGVWLLSCKCCIDVGHWLELLYSCAGCNIPPINSCHMLTVVWFLIMTSAQTKNIERDSGSRYDVSFIYPFPYDRKDNVLVGKKNRCLPSAGAMTWQEYIWWPIGNRHAGLIIRNNDD